MPAPGSWSDSISVSLTGSTNIDALLEGTRWTSSNISYSFPGFGSSWGTSSITGYGPSSGVSEPWSIWFSPLSASDQTYFSAALQQWANVANLQFSLVADTSTNVGDIRGAYSYLSSHDGAAAWAYFPDDSSSGGDVWFNLFGTPGTEVWTPGSYSNFTVLHELGHALGLKHPFSGSTVLPSSWDSQSFTVMSYSAQAGNQDTAFSFYPTTPMILDIQAIQYLYGANNNFNADDTTYFFGQGQDYHQTIWDGGGNDTITFSGSAAAEINLNAGFGSQMGNSVYILNASLVPISAVYNVWIAYGVVIENATGGGASDLLIGNDVGNVLVGNGGNDTIDGGAGSDTLIGGAGSDTLTGGEGSDTSVFNGTFSQYTLASIVTGWTLSGPDGFDTLAGIEFAEFEDQVVSLTNSPPTGSVVISGTATQGQTLIASNSLSDSDGMGAVAYQWKADGSNINGATGSTLILTADHVGTIITVVASFTDGHGTMESVSSSGTSAVVSAGVGTSSNDVLFGSAGAETIDGSAGDDAIYGDSGNDSLIGGLGNDTLDGGPGIDQLTGGAGNDRYVVDNSTEINRSAADDGIDTVQASVTYVLGSNQENLTLTGSSAINGTGNELANELVGNSGANNLKGKGDSDSITGNDGSDILAGGGGDDSLVGNGGADNLKGGGGADDLSGGGGADTLAGGKGADSLTGSTGKDTFVFNVILGSGNVDTIIGFNHVADTINLDDDIFKALATGNIHLLSAAQYRENSTGKAADADDRIIYNNSTGELYYDPDGTGPAAAIKFAVMDGSPDNVDQTDFRVVI